MYYKSHFFKKQLIPSFYLVLSFPLIAQSVPLVDYLALQPGTWTYTTDNGAIPEFTATRTELTRRISIFGGALTNLTRLTDEGLLSIRENSTIPGDPYTETQNGALVVLPPILEVNSPQSSTTTSFSGVAPGEVYGGTNTQAVSVGDFESVTVPAGTFSALKVTILYSDGSSINQNSVDTDIVWLAEGVGIVKFSVDTAEGFTGTFNLQTHPPRPSVPAGADTESEGAAIRLTWDRVDNVDDYLVYRGLSNNVDEASLIGTVTQPDSGNLISFLDSSVESGIDYHYFLESRIGTAKSLSSSSILGTLVQTESFETILMGLGLTEDEALPDADPNNDGIDNGIAYALGIPLVGSVSLEEQARLPQVNISPDTGLASLRMIIPEDVPDDVTLCIETNPTLNSTSWTEVARKIGDGAWTGSARVEQASPIGGAVSVTIGGAQNPQTEPKGFMRLRVEIAE